VSVSRWDAYGLLEFQLVGDAVEVLAQLGVHDVERILRQIGVHVLLVAHPLLGLERLVDLRFVL
jgi:hypothetical protein